MILCVLTTFSAKELESIFLKSQTAAQNFAQIAEELRSAEPEVTELMLDAGWFARIGKQFDETHYRTMIIPEGGKRICVRLWCYDPSEHLRKVFSRVGGAALFSATLAPMNHYAQQLGLDALAVGKRCCDVDRVPRDYIDARYPNAFGHSLGHGVGLYIHEQPRVSSASTTVLKPGHVVTVEPGVYIPGLGGCRIEDTVILTADGVINTIAAPKHLIEL